MTMTYLGVDSSDIQKEIHATKGCHARFSFFETLYRDHLVAVAEADGDDA